VPTETGSTADRDGFESVGHLPGRSRSKKARSRVLSAGDLRVIGQTLDSQVRALALIRDAADSICLRVRQSGSSESEEVHGQVSTTIDRLINAGISGTGQFKSERYEGVLARDLGLVLKESIHCRLAVLTLLQDKLLVSIGQVPIPPGPRPRSSPPPVAILRVFLRNNMTGADVNALARVLPSYDVRIGVSDIDPRFAREIAVSVARNRPLSPKMPPRSLASANFFPAESPLANRDGSNVGRDRFES
jgi:hypothetical protein